MALRLFLIFILFFALDNAYCQKIEYKSIDGFHSFVFNDDSTFSYDYLAGFHRNISYGIYYRDNKKLVLSSEFKDTILIPLKIEELGNNGNSKLYFEIINDMPIDTNRIYVIILDGEEVGQCKEKKLEIERKKEYSTIQLKMVCKDRNYVPIEIRDSLFSQVCDIQGIKSNNLRISWDINNKLFYYVPLKNDTLVIKKNKLIWTTENNLIFKKVTQ